MTYLLTGPDGVAVGSATPGTFGGHRRTKVYGRLDCPAASRAIARGGYVAHRVFFADEATAIAAGYRPCGACMPAAHRAWKALSAETTRDAGHPAGRAGGAAREAGA